MVSLPKGRTMCAAHRRSRPPSSCPRKRASRAAARRGASPTCLSRRRPQRPAIRHYRLDPQSSILYPQPMSTHSGPTQPSRRRGRSHAHKAVAQRPVVAATRPKSNQIANPMPKLRRGPKSKQSPFLHFPASESAKKTLHYPPKLNIQTRPPAPPWVPALGDLCTTTSFPHLPTVIPGPPHVIPAQAGIQGGEAAWGIPPHGRRASDRESRGGAAVAGSCLTFPTSPSTGSYATVSRPRIPTCTPHPAVLQRGHSKEGKEKA